MCERALTRITGRDPQLPIGPEAWPAGVVDPCRDRARSEDDGIEDGRAAGRAKAKDLVAPFAAIDPRCAHVEEAVRRKVGIEGETEQACFAHGANASDLGRRDALRHGGGIREYVDRAGTLAHPIHVVSGYMQMLRSTLALLSELFAVVRSGLPSPFRSETATAYGLMPAP